MLYIWVARELADKLHDFRTCAPAVVQSAFSLSLTASHAFIDVAERGEREGRTWYSRAERACLHLFDYLFEGFFSAKVCGLCESRKNCGGISLVSLRAFRAIRENISWLCKRVRDDTFWISF